MPLSRAASCLCARCAWDVALFEYTYLGTSVALMPWQALLTPREGHPRAAGVIRPPRTRSSGQRRRRPAT
eukprot:14794185-Alexandrium_andersonii.AAC.1